MTSAEPAPIMRRRTGWWLGLGLVAGIAIAAAAWLGLSSSGNGPTAANPPPNLVEQAAVAGIDHVYDGEFSFFVGGGVAITDCDENGFPDMYLAGGANPAALYRNTSRLGSELSFAPVPGAASELTAVVGAYPIDIDGDGLDDLAVLRHGENVLLRGVGDCQFERANELWRFDGGDEWTTAFSATWEDAAEMPTLAFGNYVELDEAGNQTGSCDPNLVYRPVAGGYGTAIELSPGWCTLSLMFSDWGRTGQRDLRATNDRHYYIDGQEQLWQIRAGAPPRLYTAEDGWEPLQIWGMGIASADITGDGLPEVFLTSQGDNKLQTLEAGASQPIYADIAIRRGVTAHRPFTEGAVMPSTAWHPEFDDVNNDRFVDLYISKGNVEAMPEYAAEDPSNLLIGQPDGTFVEGAPDAGLLSLGRSRGAAVVDLNLDGMLDIVEINRRQNIKLWRNVGSGTLDQPRLQGNWVSVRATQSGSNREAIGAWIQVRVGDVMTEREITIGGGHAGGQLGWSHFGLGDSNNAEVRVLWPDGEAGPWHSVAANGFFEIARDTANVVPWLPESS